MVEWSSTLLLIAFILYVLGTIVFTVSVTGKKFRKRDEAKRNLGYWGFGIAVLGFLFQVGYFFTRWSADGHVPVSNLFEYTTFFSIMMVLAFIIIYLIYRNNSVGIVTLPIAVIIIAYASVFPRDVEPLIPALQSYWLYIHVTTVALGEGILSLSFVAGLVYLIRVVDQTKSNARTFWLEAIMFVIVCTIGFALVSSIFQGAGYKESFHWVNEKGEKATLTYNMPAIAGPYHGKKVESSNDQFGPLFQAPSWMNGVEAPRKFNTVIWSLISGIVLYALIRLVLWGRRIGYVLHKVFRGVSPTLMDEIEYRAVAIGFPIFSLGGLLFAAIWAQEAWGKFWGWDPKEVWALVTFFFYAAYLHFRLSRGWEGEKSAWLSVVGFIIIMFNLVFVNLVIAGLHSYA
ncbi:c-type cytochrome biogenesis protein CcsB [Camelliibacillus cellulosilyticus]|uniref:C-type cytochrome biogenesis protein CcsB n=1 Tax=Camelliibacillus cellulosilyticus TaxID=2174486 RepID=A0ABV9GL19_9BACL